MPSSCVFGYSRRFLFRPRAARRSAPPGKGCHIERCQLHLFAAQGRIAPSRVSSTLAPSALIVATRSTGILVPRNTGAPPMISGSETTICSTLAEPSHFPFDTLARVLDLDNESGAAGNCDEICVRSRLDCTGDFAARCHRQEPDSFRFQAQAPLFSISYHVQDLLSRLSQELLGVHGHGKEGKGTVGNQALRGCRLLRSQQGRVPPWPRRDRSHRRLYQGDSSRL